MPERDRDDLAGLGEADRDRLLLAFCLAPLAAFLSALFCLPHGLADFGLRFSTILGHEGCPFLMRV